MSYLSYIIGKFSPFHFVLPTLPNFDYFKSDNGLLPVYDLLHELILYISRGYSSEIAHFVIFQFKCRDPGWHTTLRW